MGREHEASEGIMERIRSYGHGDEFISYLQREMLRIRIEAGFMDAAGSRMHVLIGVEALLARIEEERPDDPREFAEGQLLLMRYDRQMVELTHDAFLLAPGDSAAIRSLEKAVLRLIARAEADFPGFSGRHEEDLSAFRRIIRSNRQDPHPSPFRREPGNVASALLRGR